MDYFSAYAPTLISRLSSDFGLQPWQAAGIVGQLGHESEGLNPGVNERNPLVKGSRGGFGWSQWTGPRRREFEAWSADKGMNPASPEANYGFLKHELQGPEGRVLDRVRGAHDAVSAGRAFTDGFLRPGIPGYASRDKWTNRALQYAGQPEGAPPAFSAPDASTPAAASETGPVPSLATMQPPPIQQQPAPQQPPPSLFASLASGDLGGAASAGGGILGALGGMMGGGGGSAPPQMRPMQAPQGPSLQQVLEQFQMSRGF